MTPPLITSLALAGLAAGWAQRALIVRYAVPAGPGSGCGQRTGPPPSLAVGAVTAITLGALGARIHPGLVLAAACWLALCAIPLAYIDVAVHRLPNLLTASGYAGTATFLLLAATSSGHWRSLAQAGLGGVVLAGFYLVLALASPSGMGLGDVKLAASLGSLLAWFGWPTMLAGAVAGFMLGGLGGAALLLLRRVTRKQHIPFGPFMIAGTFLVVLSWPGAGP